MLKLFPVTVAFYFLLTGAVMAQPKSLSSATPPPPQTTAAAPGSVQPSPAAASDEPRFTNHLIGETSPYLLQHAHNPVNWYPWGKPTFDEARRRGVPIFLSAGYSTCYWCHVMERESFEDVPTADYLNAHYVAIKVDREQRPDVDDIYMAAVQMLTGSGGWPMTVFLTPPGATGPDDPGLKPFWGGTYFPKEPRGQAPSLMQVLQGINGAWTSQHDQVLQQAGQITDAIRNRLGERSKPTSLGPAQPEAALAQLMKIYDATQGGFGAAPKFPQPVFLEFLLEELPTISDAKRRDEVQAAIVNTLDHMAIGGLNDQVAGGFHRYSTDDHWLVPHFEKMLYDNAQLADLYARASETFSDSFYERVSRRTCDYVLREMTDPAGGFYSAQDAEVDHREGQNYLWKIDEVRKALSPEDADFAIKVYGLDAGTNFQDPHHPDDAPANVLRLSDRPGQLAPTFKMTEADFLARLDLINAKLETVRLTRDQPFRDDKIIVSWNGLMIAALADAGRIFHEERYTAAAAKAADFILTTMRDDSDGLFRVSRDNNAATPAFFEDYSLFLRGLLALDRAGAGASASANGDDGAGGGKYLAAAVGLVDLAAARFGDAEFGGYFDTLEGQGNLIVRTKTMYDGALPSGQSVMIHDLLDLAKATGETRFNDAALRTLAATSQPIAESPLAPIEATRALVRVLNTEPKMLDQFGMGVGSAAAAPDNPGFGVAKPADPPVQVYADVDRAVVKAGAPATVELELRIKDGFHINAHDPNVADLVGVDVRIEGGSGVRAMVAYPAGTKLKTQWAPKDERPMVHEGDLRLTVTLERTDGAWQGEPKLVVEYQACTDRMCMEPTKTTLQIAISPE